MVERPANLRELPWYVRYRLGGRVASEWRKFSVRATHRHCRVEFRGPVRLGPGFTLDIPGPGTLIVGAGVDFRRGFVCEIAGDGRVEIGDGCVFTSNTLIQCTTSIEIGPGVAVGQSALFVDGRHRWWDPEVPLLGQGYDFRPVSVGAGATIMGKCSILASIGERAVIGAHSLVTSDIPAYTLALGVPARPVEYFGHGSPPPGVPRSNRT